MCGKHQTVCDQFLQPLTYPYYVQLHQSMGTTPFSLVLSRQYHGSTVSDLGQSILRYMSIPPERRSFSKCFLGKKATLRTRINRNLKTLKSGLGTPLTSQFASPHQADLPIGIGRVPA